MTLQELSRLVLLKRRRAELHARLNEMQAASTSIAPPRLDGMPRSSSHESAVERLATKIVDAELELADLDVQIVHEMVVVSRYMSSVPDSRMRRIIGFRFLDCLSWKAAAKALGDGTTEAEVKKAFHRFLKAETPESL